MSINRRMASTRHAVAVVLAVFALSENARVHNAEGQRLAHLNSPKFTAFGSDKPSAKSFSEQVEGEVAFYTSLEDLTFEWEDDLKIDVFGDVAVVTCLLSFLGTDSDGAKVEVLGARVTLVLVRTSDGWKIVHEHAS